MTCDQKACKDDPRHDQPFVQCILSRLHLSNQVSFSRLLFLCQCSMLIFLQLAPRTALHLAHPLRSPLEAIISEASECNVLRAQKARTRKNQLQLNHEKRDREQKVSIWKRQITLKFDDLELRALPHLDKLWSSYCLAEMTIDGKICLNMVDRCLSDVESSWII